MSRRREKGLHEKVAPRKISKDCVAAGDLDSYRFPSPSYMHPKSMRMMPREDTWFEHGLDRGRSQSVPDAKHHRRPSSAYTSSTASTERQTSKSSLSGNYSVATKNQRDTDVSPQLSTFRFPEDSLFRSTEMAPSSTDASPGTISAVDRSPSTKAEKVPELNYLDWSPKHISLLFSHLELPDLSEAGGPTPEDDVAESVLMPSPLFSSSKRNSGSRQRQHPPHQTSRLSTPSSPTPSDTELSLFPKPSSHKFPTSHIHSPPPSDGEEDHAPAAVEQPGSMSAMAASPDFTPQPSPKLAPVGDSTILVCERENLMLDDATLSWRQMGSNARVPRSRLRRTQSALTLSTVAARIAKEHILQEPALDDIYALSDEDIAEAQPAPPTPAPKDSPKHTPDQKVAAQIHTPQMVSINPSSGEITPPDTPTYSNLLNPLLPSSSSGALGAIMAAGIAKKYNFDLVYLVSLWPSGQGDQIDASRQSPSKSLQRGGATIVANPKSRITGRYLAAFGDIAGFHIDDRVFEKALASSGWNEARDRTATPDRIDRGWICSFYSESVPTKSPNSADNMLHRGVVFAAFTKRRTKPTIPAKPSPEQKMVLNQLRDDAKVLVDALIEKT